MLRIAVPVVVVVSAAAWWSLGRLTKTSPKAPQITQFTSLEGLELQPSFSSPDGRKIAFVWDGPDGLNHDVYVQDVGADVPVRLTTNPAEDSNPVWSPDGKEIAFLRRVRGNSSLGVMIMDANGGNERVAGHMLELEYFHGVLAWWPDGKSLIVRDVSAGTVGFVRLIVATGDKLPLTTPPDLTHRDSDVPYRPTAAALHSCAMAGTMRDRICFLEARRPK